MESLLVKVIEEKPNDQPNPSVLVMQILADGSAVEAVWAHVVSGDFAKLVTVYFLD